MFVSFRLGFLVWVFKGLLLFVCWFLCVLVLYFVFDYCFGLYLGDFFVWFCFIFVVFVEGVCVFMLFKF